jgi:hypothetical protein
MRESGASPFQYDAVPGVSMLGTRMPSAASAHGNNFIMLHAQYGSSTNLPYLKDGCCKNAFEEVNKWYPYWIHELL